MPEVVIRGRRMFYEEHGRGFPVLFGHSYLWDARMWEPQVAVLSRAYRCIVPEIWAHGRSDPPPHSPYSVDELAEDMWAFAQALGLSRFAVVGLSVGGMWGMRLALNHPEAVAALVLMDTDAGAEPEESRQRYFAMMAAVEQAGALPPPILEALVPFFFSRPSRSSGTRSSSPGSRRPSPPSRPSACRGSWPSGGGSSAGPRCWSGWGRSGRRPWWWWGPMMSRDPLMRRSGWPGRSPGRAWKSSPRPGTSSTWSAPMW